MVLIKACLSSLLIIVFCSLVHGFLVGQKYNHFKVFKNSKSHDILVETVICQLQFEVLRDEHNFEGRPPKRYKRCDNHRIIDKKIGGDAKLNAIDAMDGFISGIQSPDIDPSTQHSPIYHFDNDKIKETNSRLINETQKLIADLNKMPVADYNIDSFRDQISSVLHAIQDFYSHSNWIEANFTGISENLGFSQDFPVPLNEGKNPECDECARIFTKEESEEYDKYNRFFLIDNDIAEWILKWRMDYDKDQVFACRNNIREVKSLFTGYVGDKPGGQNKCSHGGGRDPSTIIAPTGGINKDGEQLLFSPHYYLHEQAAEKAVEASLFYLRKLKAAIRDKNKWFKLIGLYKDNRPKFISSDDTTDPKFTVTIHNLNGTQVPYHNIVKNTVEYTVMIQSKTHPEISYKYIYARQGNTRLDDYLYGNGTVPIFNNFIFKSNESTEIKSIVVSAGGRSSLKEIDINYTFKQ